MAAASRPFCTSRFTHVYPGVAMHRLSATAALFCVVVVAPLVVTACDGDSATSTTDAAQSSGPDAVQSSDAATTVLPDAATGTDVMPASDTSAQETIGQACDPPTGARPSRRSEHAGIFDPVREQVVIHGGSFAVPVNCGFPTPTFETETWVYEVTCNSWRQVAGGAAQPLGRGRHMAVYDATGDRMIVFGGRNRAGAGGDYTLLNDTWALDLATETWSQVQSSGPLPTARVNGSLVADDKNNRLFLFGGNASPSGFAYAALNDLWMLDLASGAWSEVVVNPGVGPTPRLFTAALYDTKRNQIVIYGGADETAFANNARYFRDVWSVDPSVHPASWVRIGNVGVGVQPDGRFWGGLVHDTGADLYLLFGGHDDAALGNRNDMWALGPDTGDWSAFRIGDTWNKPANDFCDFPADFTNTDPGAPERRSAHVFVAGSAAAYTTGGKTDCGVVDDLWEWRFADGAWTELTPATVGESCVRKGGLLESCNDMCF